MHMQGFKSSRRCRWARHPSQQLNSYSSSLLVSKGKTYQLHCSMLVSLVAETLSATSPLIRTEKGRKKGGGWAKTGWSTAGHHANAPSSRWARDWGSGHSKHPLVLLEVEANSFRTDWEGALRAVC